MKIGGFMHWEQAYSCCQETIKQDAWIPQPMLSLSVSPLSVCFVVVFLALLVWLFLLVCWLTACYTPVAHFGELISSLGKSWLEERTAYVVPQVVSLSGLFLFKNFHMCTFLDIACRSYVWEDKYPNQLAQTTKRIYLASSIVQSPAHWTKHVMVFQLHLKERWQHHCD